MFLSKLSLLLLFLTSASYAQTASRMTLIEAKTFAESEVIRLKKEIAELETKSDRLSCDSFALETQLAYQEWFLQPEHYRQFEELNSSADSVITAAHAKLDSLKNQSVFVVVYQGQKSQTFEVPVKFTDLVEFFKLYDQRMKKCPQDQQAAMIEMMETRAGADHLNLVLSQVRAAGGMMTVNLNASLKEEPAIYTLEMEPKSWGYSLNLKVESDVDGVKKIHRISLLDGDEKAKAAMFSQSMIDGMPVDGLLRYRTIQDRIKGTCERMAYPSRRSGASYVKYSDVATMTKDLAGQGYVPMREMEFASIPPGTFIMGSPDDDDALPHTVTLTRAFEMQTTEVTQAQWFELMNDNPSHFKTQEYCPGTWSTALDENGMCPYHPVENVSWNDAQDFIKKLNERNDGYVYRLPTEAEWEYSARAGTTTRHFNGDSDEALRQVAWVHGNAVDQTHEVASIGGNGVANAFGLYDMLGNVFEWVQDLDGDYPKKAQIDPMGAASNEYGFRVFRGSWYGSSDGSASRTATSTQHRDEDQGFRVVRTVR